MNKPTTPPDKPQPWFVRCRGKVPTERWTEVRRTESDALEWIRSGGDIGVFPARHYRGFAVLDFDGWVKRGNRTKATTANRLTLDDAGLAAWFRRHRPIEYYNTPKGVHAIYDAPTTGGQGQWELGGFYGDVRIDRGFVALHGDGGWAAWAMAKTIPPGRHPFPADVLAQLGKAPKPAAPPHHAVDRRMAALIASQAAKVESTAEGNRDNTLHSAARFLGKVLAGHHCTEMRHRAGEQLFQAAVAAGLTQDDSPNTVRYRIERALDIGMREPMVLPERSHDAKPPPAPAPPPQQPDTDEPDIPAIKITHAHDLLARGERGDYQIDWITETFTPAIGTSLLAAAPKTGKSVFQRCEAMAIAAGQPFLGQPTTPTDVLYLALDEPHQIAYQHLAKLAQSHTPEGALDFAFLGDIQPHQWMTQLGELFTRQHYGLVIIDMMAHLMPSSPDLNDYKAVHDAMKPFREAAAKLETHVRLIHHYNKGEGAGVNRVMGSQAIAGAVDNLILLDRNYRGERSYSVTGRYGETDAMGLELDDDTGLLTSVEKTAGTAGHFEAVAEWVNTRWESGDHGFAAAEVEVDCTAKTIKRHLDRLVADGTLTVDRSDRPYRYTARKFVAFRR